MTDTITRVATADAVLAKPDTPLPTLDPLVSARILGNLPTLSAETLQALADAVPEVGAE